MLSELKDWILDISTFSDGCSQGCLAMINMANCSNVHMGLVPTVCLLCLCSKAPATQGHSTLQIRKKMHQII